MSTREQKRGTRLNRRLSCSATPPRRRPPWAPRIVEQSAWWYQKEGCSFILRVKRERCMCWYIQLAAHVLQHRHRRGCTWIRSQNTHRRSVWPSFNVIIVRWFAKGFLLFFKWFLHSQVCSRGTKKRVQKGSTKSFAWLSQFYGETDEIPSW